LVSVTSSAKTTGVPLDSTSKISQNLSRVLGAITSAILSRFNPSHLTAVMA
jgi:hypothetical protein